MVALEAPLAILTSIQTLDYYPIIRAQHVNVSGQTFAAGKGAR